MSEKHYNQAGRPTNTARINRNRDEILDNEASITDIKRRLDLIEESDFATKDDLANEILDVREKAQHAIDRCKNEDINLRKYINQLYKELDGTDGKAGMAQFEIGELRKKVAKLQEDINLSAKNGQAIYDIILNKLRTQMILTGGLAVSVIGLLTYIIFS